MAQIARPNSTIDNGGWTVIGAPTHHEAVDDEIKDDDASYVKCVEGNTMLKLALSALEEPRERIGHHARIWAMAFGSGKGESVDGYLYQGTTLIGQMFSNRTIFRVPYELYSGSVLESEVLLITDYSDLQLHFEYSSIGAGEQIRITMAEFEVPNPLTYKGPVMMII